MRVINFLAGPHAGKSVLAHETFVALKKAGAKVEFVSEYAKELTYRRSEKIYDQRHVSATQAERLDILRGQVDFVVQDTSLLLGYVYVSPVQNTPEFRGWLHDLYSKYDNLNLFLRREEQGYSNVGRTQTYAQALEKDAQILKVLERYPFLHTVQNSGTEIARHLLSA